MGEINKTICFVHALSWIPYCKNLPPFVKHPHDPTPMNPVTTGTPAAALSPPPPTLPCVHEPARSTPVCHEADLCVAGGSCTGVFAAVRAARLGLSVALIEQQSLLGGMAVAAQVNEWHSLRSTDQSRFIIGGLTREIIERLRARGAIHEYPPGGPGRQFSFNSAELALELDDLVRTHRIRLFLCARCVGATSEEGRTGRVTAAIIEDKTGRRAIVARAFIDATGDGDLLRHAGFATEHPRQLQPVNMQALVTGLDHPRFHPPWSALQPSLAAHDYPAANSTPWLHPLPGVPVGAAQNIFGARLNGYDGSNADDLTRALIEGRRLHRAWLDALHDYATDAATNDETALPPPRIVAWAHALGVRETHHARCLHRLSAGELLNGHVFSDTIAQGTYPADVHSPEGTRLRFLDGREETIARDGSRHWGRWLPSDAPVPPYYTVPYRSLVPLGAQNLLVAGRLLDADREAFGGVRVMVNMNQTGEAAGVAAALASSGTLSGEVNFPQMDIARLRATLNAGGSLLESAMECGDSSPL
ncbi:FAD-dependent oxidoreductase [Opitutaceae bacterium TAV4]|nr:FAD-dependent oxidoreductase [Opitutaceae bacterium TAV4]RRK02756.1 FAD-dependent oxidoreductase [Opitutaceae bacterium TAV3]